MKYICRDCGAVIDEEDLVRHKSYVSDYMGGCYEYYSGCWCGGDVEEASECEFCGEYFNEDELFEGVCEECWLEEMTPDNAIKFGVEDKEDVKINGFLAMVFTQEQIEEILTQALLDREDAEQLAADWLKDNKEDFAEWLKTEGGY